MNAVIVDGSICYPPTSGTRLRTYHLMLRLAKRHRITYICRSEAGGVEAQQACEFLQDHGIDPVLIHQPVPRKSGPLFYARLASNLLSPLPYSVASHIGPQLRQAIRSHAARHEVDLWQFEWSACADVVRDMPGLRKVIVAHNVDSLVWRRYFEAEQHSLKRWYIKQQWQKYERFERRLFAEVSRVVTVSREDAAIVRDQFGVPHVDVVENGIDKSYFEAVPGVRDRRRILFLGSLDYRPNADAVELMLDRVFPAVLATEPSAQLCIVGRSPPPGLIDRVRGLDHVELHANVADVRPFLGQCGVMAVPLRFGGGSRLKILEALASGLPVISTRVGAEGLRLTPERDLVIVDDVEGMAGALVEAIRYPDRILAMAEHGRSQVHEHYDWDGLANKLEQVWEKCMARAHTQFQEV